MSKVSGDEWGLEANGLQPTSYSRYTPAIEVYSVDEVFLDIAGSIPLFNSIEHIAKKIKQDIHKHLGRLTCSIGIAPNKLLAKLGSDMKKPDGLFIIEEKDIRSLLENLPVQELWGIGPKLAKHLAAIGITTCGELGRAQVTQLKHTFGIIGERLVLIAQGIDDSPVIPSEKESDAKSVGHSMTLEKDILDKETIERMILQLSEMVGRRMRKGGYSGRTVTLTIRYSDFSTLTKSKTIGTPINDGLNIYLVACDILNATRHCHPIRLLGVCLSNLHKDYTQIPLFPAERTKQKVVRVMDEINNRYGEFSITSGTLMNRYHHKGVISPAWRPKGIKCINFANQVRKKKPS